MGVGTKIPYFTHILPANSNHVYQLRKLLVGAVTPSNRYLDHRLATDFNYNEPYVVHTTHKRNPKSAGLGSSLVKTRWTHVREIGDGAFGTVTLQRSDKKEQPRLRAVKFIHRCDEQFKEVKALCRVMDVRALSYYLTVLALLYQCLTCFR